MKIIKNTTHYSTRELRRVICAVHKGMSKAEGKLPFWKRCKIAIGNSKRGKYSVSGYAFYHGRGYKPWDVFLGLPHEKCTVRTFADLVYHELMHSYGYKHTQYRDLTKAELNEMLGEEWCDQLIPLAATVAKPKPEVSVVEKRYAALLKRQQQWDAKLRRATTAKKKVDREVKVYARRHPQLLA